MHNVYVGTEGLPELDELLRSFLNSGYQFVFFNELNSPEKQVALRHDIDFDMRAAYEVAVKEHNLGIRSTFFFLLSNKNYNLLNTETLQQAEAIKKLGHHLSLQFDPANYKDQEEEGLQKEIYWFEKLFGERVNIISFHRPSEMIMSSGIWLQDIEHTYLPKYSKDILYMSDSRGLWRFGHPLETETFRQQKSMQLLLHPIWWFYRGKTNTDKIKQTFFAKVSEMKRNFSDNSRPFREIENEI